MSVLLVQVLVLISVASNNNSSSSRPNSSRRYTANVQGKESRSQRKVSCQQFKRYVTATDRLTDFKLGAGVLVKAENDWLGGDLKLQCITIANFQFSHFFCL